MHAVRAALAGGVAVASLLAPAADAAVHCVGPSTGAVCVERPDVATGSRTECYYLGGPTCTNVTIPIVTWSGETHVYCRGENPRCSII